MRHEAKATTKLGDTKRYFMKFAFIAGCSVQAYRQTAKFHQNSPPPKVFMTRLQSFLVSTASYSQQDFGRKLATYKFNYDDFCHNILFVNRNKKFKCQLGVRTRIIYCLELQPHPYVTLDQLIIRARVAGDKASASSPPEPLTSAYSLRTPR